MEERRYDAETLRKVTALADRLQHQRQDTFTAREMESIGQEVGLKPAFTREALAHLTRHEQAAGALAVRQRRSVASRW